MATNEAGGPKILAALEKHPNATAAELAAEAGVARSTAAKALNLLEDRCWVRRTPGGRDDGRRGADRWSLIAATVEATHEAMVAARRERLPNGRLRSLVLDYLGRHSIGAYTLSAIAKDLGRSAGAVSNALLKLAAEGKVVEVKARPRSYRHNPYRSDI